MIIPLTEFSGMVLGTDPTVLPPPASQACTNMDFTKRTLSGLGGVTTAYLNPDTSVDTSKDLPWPVKGAFIYSDTAGVEKLYSFAYDVDAIRSPVAQDDHKRFYWTQNNAGATDFRFALVGQNTGAYVTQSYKVGVIGDAFFDTTATDLGVSVSIVPNKPPVALSALQNMTQQFWLVDGSGNKLKDITSDLASFTGIGDPTENGWYNHYRITMGQSIADYNTVIEGVLAYRPRLATVLLGSGSAPYVVNLWENADGVVKYITAYDPMYVEALTAITGSRVDLVKAVVVENIYNEGGGNYSETRYEPLGSYWVKSNRGLSLDNDAIPATFDPLNTVTAFPEGTTGAYVWSFDYNDQHYSTMFTTNANISGTVDIGQGISGTLTENPDGLNWDLHLTFGSGSSYETRSYALTVVNRLGEESALTSPIELTLQPTKENVQFQINTATFGAKMALIQLDADRYPLHGLRLYRSVGGQFFYVGTMKAVDETALAGESYLTGPAQSGVTRFFDDTVTDAALGDACTTEGYVRKNSELSELQGLTTVYNGIIAAFKKNEVWLCEPYMPWAWKRSNVITLPHKIVDLLPYEQGVLVFTDLKTYYMSGQVPSDFVPTALPGEYPCLNKNASINVEGRAMYISTDGPAYINGMQVVVDQVSMTRDRWRDILNYNSANGGDIRLVHYGHRALAYFGGSFIDQGWGTVGGIMLDITKPNWTFIDFAPTFAMHAPANSFGQSADHLVYVTTNRWQIAFNEQTSLVWNWWSKDFILPIPTNFGAFQIFGTGNIRVLIKADDRTPYTVELALGASGKLGSVFRLPSGFLAARWSIALVGLSSYQGLKPEVSRFYLATSIGELKGV